VALLGEYQHRATGQIKSLVDIVAQTVTNIKAAYDPQQFPKPKPVTVMPLSSAGLPAKDFSGDQPLAGSSIPEASGVSAVGEVGVAVGAGVPNDLTHEKPAAGASHAAAAPIRLHGGDIRGETMDMRLGGAVTERRYADRPTTPVQPHEAVPATTLPAPVEMAPPAPAFANPEHEAQP
jgi:hypothetical protein